MRYPIGVQDFKKIIEGRFVYVDKTDLVYRLAQNTICFLCRPRRFGKSLLMSTLKYYFLGEKELFKGLKIENLETEWQQHPVFHLDFNGVNFAQEGQLEQRIESFVKNCETKYPYTEAASTTGDRFACALHAAYQQTGHRAVVLIDEYDKPILDVLDTPLEERHRNILKGFYSVFKAADADLRFVLLTGVTKFSQVSIFSGFNQPNDVSLDEQYECICGISEEELHEYFEAEIENFAVKKKTTKNDIYSLLKKNYDGYHFSNNLLDIYNPFSIINCLSKKEFDPYWFRTGTPTYLTKLLSGSDVNIEQMLQKDYEADYFANYRADVQKPLPMLFQSGYLTIKSYNSRRNTYKLDFPNLEVRKGFINLLSDNYFKSNQDCNNLILDIADMLDDARLDDLRDTLTAFLASVDYEMRFDKEQQFQYTLYLIFSLLSAYTVSVERHNSRGRCDLVVETEQHIYIFEFKLDGTIDEAFSQIEERGYALPYAADSRQLHKIAAIFGTKSGTIDQWEVR